MDNKTKRKDLQELIHSFNIIQNQLLESNEQQREIIRKMSTKQSLLLESRKVLQEQLGTSLLEDYSYSKKNRLYDIKRTTIEKKLVPIIITSSAITEPTEDWHNNNNAKEEEKIRSIKCQGWIRENRIWIQAQALIVSETKIIQISCIPTNFLPETTLSNTNCNIQQQQHCEFYTTFDLLPDISISRLKNELKVTFLIENQSTKTCHDIEWIMEQEDLTWIKQVVSILLANELQVIQAYFPYHIRVYNELQKEDLITYINNKGFPCSKYYNENILLSQDQKWIIHTLSKDDYFDLYGLTSQITAKITNILFPHHVISTTKKTLYQNQELIKSLGDQVMTLTKKIHPNSRIHTATILSQY